jgi:hypothetical protein
MIITARVAMVVTDAEDSSKDVSFMIHVIESNGFKFEKLMTNKIYEITIKEKDETDLLDF